MRSLLVVTLVLATMVFIANAGAIPVNSIAARNSKPLSEELAAKAYAALKHRSENIDVAHFAKVQAEMNAIQKRVIKAQSVNPVLLADAYLPYLDSIGQPFNGFVGGGSFSATGTATSFLTTGTNATGGVSTPVFAGYSGSKTVLTVNVGTNFNYWNVTHSVLCVGGYSPLNTLNNKCYWSLGGVASYQAAYAQLGLTDVIISLLYGNFLPLLQYTGLVPDLSSPNRMGDLFEVDPLHGWWVRWVFTELFCEDLIGPGGSDIDIGSIYTTNDIRLTNIVSGEPSQAFIGVPASLLEAFANAQPVALITNCGQA